MGTSRRVESHESTEVPVDDGEISGVRDKDLVALQSFELDGSLENSSEKLKGDLDPEELQSQAEDLKDKGNTLFKLGDMEAAAEVFGRVLLALEPPPGVGEVLSALFWCFPSSHLRSWSTHDFSATDGYRAVRVYTRRSL